MPKTPAALVAVMLSLTVPDVAVAPAAARPQGTPQLVTEVLSAPRPVPGTDRRTHLVYEILMRNDAAGRSGWIGCRCVTSGSWPSSTVLRSSAGCSVSTTACPRARSPPGGSGCCCST